MATPETELTSKPLSIPEFAARIRAKHPKVYDEVDDVTLAAKVTHKYPKYLDKVDFGDPAQAQSEVDAAKAQFETAQASLLSGVREDVSPLGKQLNPDVVQTVKRPKLKPNEEGIVSLASDTALLSATPGGQAVSVPPTSPSPSQSAPPVSLDPVIQGRLEAAKKQRRQQEIQRRVANARQVRQRQRAPQQPIDYAAEGLTDAGDPALRPQPSGAGELRKRDAPALAQILRIERQVAQEQSLGGDTIRNRPGPTPHQEVLRRLADEKSQEAEANAQTAWHQENAQAIADQAAQYRADIQKAKARGGDANKWLAEMGSKGAAGLTELVGGVVKPFDPALANKLRVHVEAATQAAVEEGAARSAVSRGAQDIVAGFVSSAPELAAMMGGLSAPLVFGAGGGARAYGAERPIAPAAAKGALTGAAFELPVGGAGLGHIARKAGAVGLGTGAVELGFGATPQEALKAGATNALLAIAPAATRIPKAVVDYTMKSPITPEPVKNVVADALKYGKGMVTSPDGRNMSLYADPATGEVFGAEITPAQAKKYDPTIVTGEKRAVRNAKEVDPEDYDILARTLGIETKAPAKQLAGEVLKPEPRVEKVVQDRTSDVRTEKSSKSEIETEKAQQITPDQPADVHTEPKVEDLPGIPVKTALPETLPTKAETEVIQSSPVEVPAEPAVSPKRQNEAVTPAREAVSPTQPKPVSPAVREGEKPAPESVIDTRDAIGTAILAKPEWKGRVLAEIGEGGTRVPFGQETGSGLEFIAKNGDRVRVSNARYSDKQPTVGTKSSGLVIEREPSPQAEAAKPVGKPTTYFQGDRAEYTGKEEMIAGGKFYAVKMLEGPFKGQEKVVKDAPPQRDTQPTSEAVADISPSTEASKQATPENRPQQAPSKASNAAQKLPEWGKRLKSIAETRSLSDLQSLSDEMAEHKDDPKVARLRTVIQAEIARARQPKIPESPKTSNNITTERAEPQKLSQKATKLRAESERPEGKTVRPKPTHRIGAPKSNPAKNSVSDEVRALGGIKDTRDREYAGDLQRLKESGKRGVVNETGGTEPGAMAAALAERGYFMPGVERTKEGFTITNVGEFLNSIYDDAAGSTKYHSTAYDVIESDPDVEAWDSLAESDYGKEVLERVQSGHARASEIAEFVRQAKEHGLSDDATDDFLNGLHRTVQEELSGRTEEAEGYSLDQDGTLLDPDGNPLFSREFQLGLPSEGLTQQSAEPKTTSQRDALIRDAQEREDAANPERAKALQTLAEIRRRGMTVDEYARQGALFGPKPSADEIALLKELETPSKAKSESAQESMFTKGEAGPQRSGGEAQFTVRGNHVSLENARARQLLNQGISEAWPAEQTANSRGVYLRADRAGTLAETLRQMGDAEAKRLGNAIEQAAMSGRKNNVTIAAPGARVHELFHEASDAESRSLRNRHADMDSLTAGSEWPLINFHLLRLGYPDVTPTLVEEAAAHIAEGRYEELGLSRDEAVDWMNKWFTSFAKKNPNVTPATFKELSNEAEEARNKVYAAKSRISERESDEDVPSVQEGREGGDRANFARATDQTDTPEFKRWFAGSKVVDGNGNPLVVYSGHGNLDLWGDRFDPKRGKMGGAGAFYATESTEIASNYAHTKLGGQGEFNQNGDQYRFKLKNGKWGKKIWQIELTPEQQATARDFINHNQEGEQQYDIEQYWKENASYDAESRRALARGGLRDLQSIWQFLEYMGDNIAYPAEDVADAEGNRKPYFQRQRKNTFELLLDKLGIEWQSSDWSQPGVIPIYLRIRNPIDAEKPFPADALDALKQAAKRTRTVAEERTYDNKWTGDYPLRQWVKEIEEGYEYWSTQVPTKAIPILKGLGYDGIKEVGLKGESDRAKRQINWIAFDATQIKSAIGNRGTFDPNNPNILMSIESDDPWTRLGDLAEEFDRIANEPDLPEGEKPLSLPKTLDAAGLESGPTKGYTPETLAEGVEFGKQVVADKGIDGAMEFVRNGDGIEWASTGYEVLAQLRAQQNQLEAEGKADEAAAIQERKLKFLDDFALAAAERGRSVVGIKAAEMFAPDRLAFHLNKVSLKKRKRGISPQEDAAMAAIGEQLGALEDRNKALEKALDIAKAQASKRAPKGTKPKKSDYQSRLDAQAESILVTLKPKVGKFDFAGLGRASEKGALTIGIPPLPGDAELIAQYAASRLGKTQTVAELNDHLLSEFGQEIEPFLPKIRQRAYGIRQEARLAEIEAQETEPKRRKTILAEIQKEIAESLTAIREAQKAQDSAMKAERRSQATEMRAEARTAARQARELEAEQKKQIIRQARADLKRLREEMKQANRAETAGYRETIKAQREAARRAELWDTPLRNEAAAARERLKTATDVKDPQTMADLVSVAAEKFLPDEIGGVPRKAGVEPAKVYRDLKDEFPDLVTKKNQAEIYKRGYQRIQDMTAAAREAARMRSASAEVKRLWDELGVDVDAQAVLIKQAEVRRQTDELRRKAVAEFNRVSRTFIERAWHESNAFFRAAMSSVDAPMGRQGWFLMITHPALATKYAIPASARGYTAIHQVDFAREIENLKNHPRYDLAIRAGLQITEPAGSGNDPRLNAEEMFSSPAAEKIPHIRLSEQGYVGGMNWLRLPVFDVFASIGESEGATWETDPEYFKQAANFINDVSGRGTMGQKASVISSFLNGFFYSTRLNVSRFQMVNDLFNPIGYIPEDQNPLRDTPGFRSYHPIMRKVAAQQVLRLALGLAAIFLLAKAAGFSVEFDPEDSDSLLIRFRNTRWDVTGGEPGTIRFVYRFVRSVAKMAKGEDLAPFEEPDELVLRYLRYKLAPIPSGVVDGLTGKDAVGNPASFATYKSPKQFAQENIIFKRVTPMMTGTFIDTISQEGWLGIPMALPALLGYGVSSYPDRGIRAIKNKKVVDALEGLKINSQSLIGQKTKDDDLDEAIQKRILERVENLKLPEGTEIGRETLIRERLENIRAVSKAETALDQPAKFKDYLVNRAGKESFSFLSDEDRAQLTEADVKKYRTLYADAYLTVLKNAWANQNKIPYTGEDGKPQEALFKDLPDDVKAKMLDRASKMAHNVAKGKMRSATTKD